MTDEVIDDWDGYPTPSDEDEIVLAGHVYNIFYVYYDKDGKVYAVSNTASEEFSNFEIDINLIQNFVDGKKDPTKFDIEYFYNISKGLIVDSEELELAIKSDTLLYTITDKYVSSDEIVIEHDTENLEWVISARKGLDEKLSIIPSINLFICKKNDPHFLYSSYSITLRDLIDNAVRLPFKTDIEKDFDSLTLTTLKKFNSYGILRKQREQSN
jgi:hypothetical protein